MPVPPCLTCCSSVINFEVKKCKPSSFILLSQDCFGYLYPLHLHVNFRIALSISAKLPAGIFDRDFSEPLKHSILNLWNLKLIAFRRDSCSPIAQISRFLLLDSRLFHTLIDPPGPWSIWTFNSRSPLTDSKMRNSVRMIKIGVL